MRVKRGFKEKEAGTLIGHYPCIFGGCSSSDGMAVYQHADDSHSAYCFVCEQSKPDIDFNAVTSTTGALMEEESWMVPDTQEKQSYSNLPTLEEVRDNLIPTDNRERKLRADVYELYGCRMELQDDGETIEKIFYPTYRKNEHVGYRIRGRIPEGHEDAGKLKNFKMGKIGDTSKGIQLFGQWLFSPEQHKRLFISEGEEDCISGYKMTSMKTKFDGGYAFVSVPSGANVAGLKSNLEYISKFEEIFLCFDNDKPGKEFLEKAVKLLPVGKVRIVKLPKQFKDISDMWRTTTSNSSRQAMADTLWKALWSAEKYSPAGVFGMSEGWNNYLNRGKEVLVPFPHSFGNLNARTYGGYALGEIVTIAAPSSVGKSSFTKEMIYTALEETNYNIAVCSFEETLDEFIEGFLSIHMSTQLNEVEFDLRDRGEEYEAFQQLLRLQSSDEKSNENSADEETVTKDRIHFLDHQGACSGEELLDKIDFMIDGLECKIIIVDPVTLALSASDMFEDEFASEIVKRVKRKNIAWINIHHVRKNQGGQKANSEGGDVSEEDMKGSGTWFQTSMINLLLTRNKVHDNEIVRNTTTIKMSKCRRHGKSTGIAGWVYYNGVTGRLELGQNPDDLDECFDGDFL